jgi:hypothetical protein
MAKNVHTIPGKLHRSSLYGNHLSFSIPRLATPADQIPTANRHNKKNPIKMARK